MAVTPDAAARMTSGGGSPPPGWLVRVLGGRMALQGMVLQWVRLRHRNDLGRVYRLGAVVDLLHGASMIGAAAAFPRYRRSALLSATLAFVAAGMETAAAR